jgi:hypothetical protein
MDSINLGFFSRSLFSASKDEMLNESDPQKRILRGSEVFFGLAVTTVGSSVE